MNTTRLHLAFMASVIVLLAMSPRSARAQPFAYVANGAANVSVIDISAHTNGSSLFGSLTSPFPSVIDLSKGERDVIILGDEAVSSFGDVVAGDVNGDSIEDLIISASSHSTPSGSEAGLVYIFYGSVDLPDTIDLSVVSADVTILGEEAGAFMGRRTASGDINGDGIEDVIIGAHRLDGPGGIDAGAVYVIYGSPNLPATIDFSAVSADVIIYGGSSGELMGGPNSIGDVNGDGFGDIIIGASNASAPGGTWAGKVYVIYGGASLSPVIDLSSMSADVTILGDDPFDHLGATLTSGDVNGDGYDDIIAQAPRGNADAGETNIVYGGSAIPSVIDLNASEEDVRILGAWSAPAHGKMLSSGDVNGDGLDDILIAGPVGDPPGRTDAGVIDVVFGSVSLPAVIDISAGGGDVAVWGEEASLGMGGIWTGDFNGDGIYDLILGAGQASPGGRLNAGKVYIIYGGTNLPPEIDLNLFTPDVLILGDDAGDAAGAATSGDLNGDGIADIIVSAGSADPGGISSAGEIYIIFGTAPLAPVINVEPQLLDFGGVFLGSMSSLNVTVSNVGNDTLNVSDINSSSNAFGISDTSFSLQPDSSRLVNVTFTPDRLGSFDGTLTLISNDPMDSTVSVSLTGEGTTLEGHFAYVTTAGDFGTVSVIDIATNTVVATVGVGADPKGVTITPDGAFAYVANDGSDNVSVIDIATNSVVATVSVGVDPIGVAITPDGAFTYVSHGGFSGTISVIATATNTVVATVSVGTHPEGIAITPDGAFAYVVNNGNSTVSVITTATNTVITTVSMGSGPSGVAITPDGAFAYVANNSGAVRVIDIATNTVVSTVDVGSILQGVAITPDGAFAYITNFNSNNVSVIDIATNTVVATVDVGSGSRGVAITPDGAFAYITNWADNNVSVVDIATNTVIATVGVGVGPKSIAITPVAIITEINERGKSVPIEYTLMQNYPNPFNPMTAISYDLPAVSDVKIVIYNLMGQEVRSWDIQEQPAGYHQVIWNASDIASGIYFYRLRAGDYISTKKMILLK